VSAATLTSKGQTTIPKDVRDHLHLRPGDRLEFVLTDDAVLLRPITRPITDLKGFLPKPRKPVTIEEMNATIRRRGAGAKK
jgi:antitoxin PrlF